MAALTLRVALLFIVNLTVGLTLDTILGDRVQFPETEHCSERGAKLQHTLTSGSSQTVAHLEDVWKPADGYEYRMSPNESVILNRSNINDQGLYSLTCGSVAKLFQLNVIISSEKSVTEGEAAGFTFHYFTAGKLGRYRVERNKQLVFELDLSSGNTSQGSGFENRTSVAPHWRSDGDLTLTLQRVKLEDRGDYIFHVFKDNKRKHVQAVRMRVSPAPNTEDRNPEQTTFTPQPPCKEKTALICVSVAAVLLIAGAFYCGQKNPRICVSGGAAAGGAGTELEMPPYTDTPVPVVNGHA
ncbi:hypothetical protein KUCAC02_007865 [Chaenocephalus aceratus]|uniref:Uncharacterized protein n=1 Tax=Chaenocephalus aceratus TaxID=36190 RepID=A0ACB9X847_CHAAC|nr:hypothetical protein KUCAC02_007865 [Chaenocephalus aceratus]